MSRGKTALVTGAAVRIGAVTVRQLHARGCDVLVHCNSRRQEAEKIAAELNTERLDSAFVAQADLSTPRGVDALAGACRETFGQLDILVNNASRFYPTDVGQTLAWQWDDLINSNLRGTYFLVQALLGELQAAKGCVVNIVDIHAERPMPGYAVYNISKAGIAMMTKTLAQEWAEYNIRINAIAPGVIESSGLETYPEVIQASLNEARDANLMKRFGTTEDVAHAVMFYSSPLSSYISGTTLYVDGLDHLAAPNMKMLNVMKQMMRSAEAGD